MPTSTFFNLPHQKQEKLICAIKEEFARVPFHEVSINKIVQSAKIPRGSFYQYFEDKTDMLKFILADYQQAMLDNAKESLIANNGDIFVMFTDVLDFTIDFVSEGQPHEFCKNLFSDISINSSICSSMMNPHDFPKGVHPLIKYVNTDVLDIRSEEDFIGMIRIFFSIVGHAIAESFFDVSKCTLVKEVFANNMELLKRGFLKNKEI
jgi:Transcriptional regulator